MFYLHVLHKNQPCHVAKYTVRPMDPMSVIAGTPKDMGPFYGKLPIFPYL